jgi:hypothetical protein
MGIHKQQTHSKHQFKIIPTNPLAIFMQIYEIFFSNNERTESNVLGNGQIALREKRARFARNFHLSSA